MYIKSAGDVGGLVVLKETQSIRSCLNAVDLGGNLHSDMLIRCTIILVDNLIAGRTRFQYICALFPVTGGSTNDYALLPIICNAQFQISEWMDKDNKLLDLLNSTYERIINYTY